MRTRSLGLTLFSGLAILLSACSNTGSGASAGASAAPDPCAGAAANASHTQPTDWSKAKIGVVTDVGTLDDKNFNEYTVQGRPGRRDGRSALRTPPAIVPKDASRVRERHPGVRRPGLQHHRHGRLQPGRARRPRPRTTTRTSGSSASTSRRSASTRPAHSDTDVRLQGRRRDAAAELHLAQLPGGPGRLPGRHRRRLGRARPGPSAPSAASRLCGPCVRYIQGYELGAKSVNPNIKVVSSLRHESDFSNKAFNDPVDRQELRAAVPARRTRRRRPVPGRRQDRQRRARGRLRRGHLRHRRRRRPVRCRTRTPPKCIVTSAEKHLAAPCQTDDPGDRRRHRQGRRQPLGRGRTMASGMPRLPRQRQPHPAPTSRPSWMQPSPP